MSLSLTSRLRVAIAAAAVPVYVAAQPPEPVKWSVQSAPQRVAAGEVARVQVQARMDEGWHLYALDQEQKGPMPTQLTAGPQPPFTLKRSDIESPEPERTDDPNFGVETAWYAGSVTFTLPIAVAKETPVGQRTIEVRARFQACNDTLCLRPATVTLPVTIAVRKR